MGVWLAISTTNVMKMSCKGVFLVMTKNAFLPVKRVYSVNTYLRITLSHEGVSEASEQASS